MCVYTERERERDTYIKNTDVPSYCLQRGHFVLLSLIRSTGWLIQWATMHNHKCKESIRTMWLEWREGWD